MRQTPALGFFVLLLLVACKNGPVKKEGTNFFPVASFIDGQVHTVDSLRLPVQKLTTINNRTDTVLIGLPEFKQLAAGFKTPDINDSSLSRYYTESSFADQSIASVTLTYSTKDSSLPLQRLDVIIHPDPVLNDQVQSIYLEKAGQVKDTLIVKKLYWRADRNFQIITSKQSGAQATSTVVKVVWNARY